jgi:hypothetical protein
VIARASSRRAAPAVIVGVAVAVSLMMLASRADYIPMWDGRIYADCIIDAAQQRLSWSSLRCADHISYAYMVYAGALQLLSPGSFPLMLLANTLLWLLACAAFHRLTQVAFPGSEHGLDRSLLTAAFAFQPAILASVVQPNIDLPMLPAFLWATVFIVRLRWIPAILTGIALIGTKESGVLLYLTLVFSYGVAMVMPGPRSTRSPFRAMWHLAPLSIPVIVFAVFIAYRIIVPHDTVLAAAGTTDMPILQQFLVPRIDPYFVNYVVMMCVLSFAWVSTVIVGSDAVFAIGRAVRKLAPRPLPGAKRRVVRFLLVLGVVSMWALTRYSSWGNSRYLLPVFALTPLMLYAALIRFGVPTTARRSLLGALAVLLGVSVVRTIDPVSKALYGTWTFGEHRLLRMTSVTGECCAAGRDQLVYNLQYTALAGLTSDATAALVRDSTIVFYPTRMDWQSLGPLDSASSTRTLRRVRTFTPPLLYPDTLRFLASPPRNAVYIGIPNGDVAGGLRKLSPWYDAAPATRVQRDGYSLDAYRLTLRERRE